MATKFRARPSGRREAVALPTCGAAYQNLNFFFFFFWLLAASAFSRAASSTPDKRTLAALLAFKGGITADPTGFLRAWNASSPAESSSYCRWPGVTCAGGTENVTRLELESRQFRGVVAPELMTALPFLAFLNLSNNSLSGGIPAAVGDMRALTHLDLSLNTLSGRIPPSLANCSRLEYLDLSQNALSGPLPSSFTNLSSLAWVQLFNNSLSGPLPQDWSSLHKLNNLRLYMNSFSGPLPPSIGNCTSLTRLSLEANFFSGIIPPSFGNLLNLTSFIFFYNNLTGPIPPSISNCTKLQYLSGSYNNLTGPLPGEIGKLAQLQWLSFSGNTYLQGSLPDSIGNCQQLRRIWGEHSGLGGKLPNSLFNLSNLIDLKLTSGSFSGSLSEDVGNVSLLLNLHLGDNALTGEIPQGLGKLQTLQGLDLQGNLLTGSIPSQLASCTSLSELDLSNNHLSGPVPAPLFRLLALNKLSLQNNRLYGDLPDTFSSSSRLNSLNVANNNFTGVIPSSLANLNQLNLLLDLSYNSFIGPIPPTLGGMRMVPVIRLSGNKLSGQIPSTLGNCLGLMALDLSQNELQEQIPDMFGSMKSLQYLNLSHNELSGALPPSLAQIQGLLYLDVSSNRLVGRIPQEGIYKRFTPASYMGNPGLCGYPLSAICAFPTEKGDNKRNVALATAGAIASVLVVFCACACCWWWSTKKRSKSRRLPGEESLDIEMPRIKAWTARELREATNGFDTAYIIGSGSVGVCFKGVREQVQGEKIIAIKRLNIYGDDGGADARRSFVTELKTLCKTRHRNLVKVLGYSVDGGMVALVMEYMEKGSLEDHLHGDGSNDLSWDERLNVAIDVAEGLVYLHEEYMQPIIHCDLKPRNILLGTDMVAKISDFGIAKLLDGKNLQNSLTISKFRGTFGYAAPEYAGGYHISTKADVYSYGVLLLELVTGLRPTSDEVQERGISLAQWVEGLVRSGRASEALHPTLEAAANASPSKSNPYLLQKEAEELLCIAISCSSPSPKDRPTMKLVKDFLLKLRAAPRLGLGGSVRGEARLDLQKHRWPTVQR